MGIEIRTIGVDEVGDYLRAGMRGFHVNKVSDEHIELRRQAFTPGRSWVAIDGTDIVATLRTAPIDTTMPGGTAMPTAGVTNVTVASTHRRQGLMARLLAAELHAARDRGEPIASLIAAEWPIYGRFGFGPAVDYVEYELTADATWTNPGEGTIELVDPATLLAHAPAVYDRHRATSVGEITRHPTWWSTITHTVELEPWKGFQVLCRDRDGEVSGYAIYSIAEHWEHRKPDCTLKVDELVATDLTTEARLWRDLCEVDWVTRVTAESRRVHEPLHHWVTDGRALTLTERTDMVWARTLDTPAALTGRAYAGAGTVVLDVDDPMKLAGGRFRLETDGTSAACAATTDAPDVSLPMFALGAILYGGTSLVDLHLSGLVIEHQPGAVVRTDGLFRWPVTPWSMTWF
jgi:predicted acetyltransferase